MSWWRSVTLPALALVLAGCGFQLRGQFSIPVALQPVHIEAVGGSDVARELRDLLRNSKVRIADQRADAASEIQILEERRERRVLTISAASAEVDEFELRYTTTWLLRDTGEQRRPLTRLETIEGLRDYTFDRTAVLATQSEEAALVEDLQQDAALRILYRLQAWQPDQAPAPEEVEIEQELRDGG
ncbi:MAG: LPS assembly lipoprotein LptE [Halofilum sp. (in: g-proteobacteria)]|nr:LPS assembly lipoprotein LptE [Halofilum sp. (in: g-proteobacteria)]